MDRARCSRIGRCRAVRSGAIGFLLGPLSRTFVRNSTPIFPNLRTVYSARLCRTRSILRFRGFSRWNDPLVVRDRPVQVRTAGGGKLGHAGDQRGGGGGGGGGG